MATTITIAVVSFLVGFTLISELIHLWVFGRLLPDSQVVSFLDHYLNDYVPNDFTRGTMIVSHANFNLPYIAKSKGVLWPLFLTKYHLQDYGCVSRWSNQSKRLDAKFASLDWSKSLLKKKTLADLIQK